MLRRIWLGAFFAALGWGGAYGSPLSGQTGIEAGAAVIPEVWMLHRDWAALSREDAGWDFVKQHLDGFQFYIDSLKEKKALKDGVASGSLEDMRRLGAELQKHGIVTSVECGGTLTLPPLDDSVGERAAAVELAKLEFLTKAGIELDYLNMDGPVRRLTIADEKPGVVPFDSIDRAVDETIDAMRLHRKARPQLKFVVITNFPNWAWKEYPSYSQYKNRPEGWGQYYDALTTLIRKTREAGMPIEGVICDNPYDYAIGEVPMPAQKPVDPKTIDWIARMRDLEDLVEGEGMTFTVTFNSQRGGKESARRFYEETLKFIDVYQAAGGSPLRYNIQSWYPHPREAVPEDEPYTMTNLVREVIRRVKKVE